MPRENWLPTSLKCCRSYSAPMPMVWRPFSHVSLSTNCSVLLSTANGPSVISPMSLNPVNETSGMPHVTGSPDFRFGIFRAPTTSLVKAERVPIELKNLV